MAIIIDTRGNRFPYPGLTEAQARARFLTEHNPPIGQGVARVENDPVEASTPARPAAQAQPRGGGSPRRATGNNGANANPSAQASRASFTGMPVVSLGTLVMAFVARPLAELKDPTGLNPRFAEVQVYFYNFNNKASIMSRCNISEFPINTAYFSREYARLRMENTTRAVNLNVAEFINFLATKMVDDVMNPAYGMTDLYKPNQTEQTQKDPRNFEKNMTERMRRYNISGSSDFIMPQLVFELEAVPAIINNRLETSQTILKLHLYDRTCSANSSLRELLAMSTNTVMTSLSSFPTNQASQSSAEDLARSEAISGQGGGRGRRTAANIQQAGEQAVDNLRRSWSDLHQKLIREVTAPARNPPLLEVIPSSSPPQYRFVGGAQAVKEYCMENVPHIIYGAMGTTVKTANLSSRSDALLSTVNMQRSMNASPVLATGEQAGGVPLTIYPVELNITSLGCPMIRYSQEVFVDFNTNTTADDVYVVTGVNHKIEQGSFETTIKLTGQASFGKYRSLIEQLNTARLTANHIANPPETNPSTPTRR